MEPYHYIPGSIPLIVSIPHTGTYVPESILERFTPEAKQLPDTDWHVDRLYGFARELGAHVLVATHSRYVVDLNRAADGESLYPGKFTTGLCPVTLFDGSPLYRDGMQPDANEIRQRTTLYWQPYHDKLQSIIAGFRKVVLFDAHSICSQAPLLFDGILPDLNLGTADGTTTDAQLVEKLLECCRSSSYSMVYNGRFKGGYITRHYGNPAKGVQAVQLELAQHNYMEEAYPYTYNEMKAQPLQSVLRQLLTICSGYSTR